MIPNGDARTGQTTQMSEVAVTDRFVSKYIVFSMVFPCFFSVFPWEFDGHQKIHSIFWGIPWHRFNSEAFAARLDQIAAACAEAFPVAGGAKP